MKTSLCPSRWSGCPYEECMFAILDNLVTVGIPYHIPKPLTAYLESMWQYLNRSEQVYIRLKVDYCTSPISKYSISFGYEPWMASLHLHHMVQEHMSNHHKWPVFSTLFNLYLNTCGLWNLTWSIEFQVMPCYVHTVFIIFQTTPLFLSRLSNISLRKFRKHYMYLVFSGCFEYAHQICL